MRYTNGAPNTVYLVVNTNTGDIYSVNTSMARARASLHEFNGDKDVRIAKYDPTAHRTPSTSWSTRTLHEFNGDKDVRIAKYDQKKEK